MLLFVHGRTPQPPGLTFARTLVHDVSCTTDTSGYHTITESNLAAQKSGSWTWRDPDVAHLSKALSINLPLYARAARKQSSKAPLRELSNQSLHSNCSQGQGEQLDELHVGMGPGGHLGSCMHLRFS